MLSQILSAISAVRQFISWGIAAVKLVSAWIFRRKLKAQEEKTNEATKELQDANLISDDQKRLAEKAKAANELEKSLRSH